MFGQVIVHFMRTAVIGLSRLVKLAVLQAPVSDREAAPDSGMTAEMVTEARQKIDSGEPGAHLWPCLGHDTSFGHIWG